MPTVNRRGKRYRVQVRLEGFDEESKTFGTSKAAWAWGHERERELRESVPTNPKIEIDKLIEQYATEIAPKRKGLAPSHLKHDIPAIKSKFKNMKMADLQGDGLVQWVLRSDHLSGPTRYWHIMRLRGVLRQCELKWKIKVPWKDIDHCMTGLMDGGYLTPARERDRRVSDDEIAAIKAKLHPATATWFCDIIDFSLATAMRIGEVCRIRWDDFNEHTSTVLIRDRKHPKRKMGNHKLVPLLNGSVWIVQRQSRTAKARFAKQPDGRIFPRSTHYVSKLFHEAAVRAGVKNVRLHDLRHEGISRLFELGFQIQEVALVSGHEDWKTLRRYTHLRPASLVAKEAQLRALLAT